MEMAHTYVAYLNARGKTREESWWPSVLFVIVALFVLGGLLTLLTPPTIDSKPLNMSPVQSGDTNASILPSWKQDYIYSYLIVVNTTFQGKEYLAAYPNDAVTIASDGGDITVKIYTNDPNTTRVEKYTY
jgi:hypothetical protein